MSGARILVVDDDYDIRFTISEVLQDEGYAVAAATNGREALEYLRTHDPPDLILLDLNMPIMSGWEFRTAQCADARLASIPVVVISATSDVSSKATQLSAQGVLRKPVELEELLATVAKFSTV